MDAYRRTDLAIEGKQFTKQAKTDDYMHTQLEKNGILSDTVRILSDRGAKAFSKPIGTYITLTFPASATAALSDRIADCLRQFLKGKTRILTVGLGNRDITADAIGPLSVTKLSVNGHLETAGIKRFAISPDVLGKTGIESIDLIKAAKEAANADAVIVIDALAARDASRLYRTVQIGTSGIVPGSGVGNHRHAIDENTLGVPVIAIGVPTVVSTATLLYNTLEAANLLNYADLFTKALHETEPFFVTPPDADIDTDRLTSAIAEAIHAIRKDTL